MKFAPSGLPSSPFSFLLYKNLNMRRKRKQRRIILSEPVYNNVTVAKFINQVMKKGKKTIARKIVYQAFDVVKEKTQREPLEIFDLAIENTSPFLEVKPKRIGGATYQVPREVRGDRRMTLAMRWILQAARDKKGKPMKEKLANELIEAANNQGAAIKKKENMHRMAEANRAFAHFTW
jgi:small subunit ribosomal protein S7